jgi:hypothetical protein
MATEEAELTRQRVRLGLEFPARGYYNDIDELRDAVKAELAAREEAPFLDDERIRLGVQVPPGGFPNATLYKAAITDANARAVAAKLADQSAATSAAQQQAVAAATATAQASVDRYTLSFTALQGQKDQMQKTLELMMEAKELYSGVSNDLHYSVDEFTKNIADLQNEINITNRKIASPTWYPWLDMFLNVMLVLVLLYAIYVLVTKIYVRPVIPQFQYPY